MKKLIAFLILFIGMIYGTGYAINVGNLKEKPKDVNRFTALFAAADIQFNTIYMVELKELKSSSVKQFFVASTTLRIRKELLHIVAENYNKGDDVFLKARFGRRPRDAIRCTAKDIS